MSTFSSHNPDGQGHDRFHPMRPQDEGAETLPLTPPSLGEDMANAQDPPEITVVQRMFSATTGSLLTGLLVTPLDVVRIRWQSQQVSQPVINVDQLPANFRKIIGTATAASYSPASMSRAAFRPSDLGVTACCREVFFMNANTEMCLAGAGGKASVLGQVEAAAEAEAEAAISNLNDCAVEQHQQKTFNSTLDGLRKIARNEGLFTLWRGLSPTLVMSIPANVIYFTGYEWLRYNPHSPVTHLLSLLSSPTAPASASSPAAPSSALAEQYAPLLAGSSARVLAATSVGPIELFRTRLQAAEGGSSASSIVQDTFQDMRSMVQLHGYRSLWRGMTLTLWRDVPFSGMYWWGYETVRGKITEARERRRERKHDWEWDGVRSRGRSLDLEPRSGAERRRRSQSRENHRNTFVDSFAAGALSGAAASIATMPFDVGKTRTQVFHDVVRLNSRGGGGSASTATAAAANTAPEAQNMGRLLWHIYRTEGVAGLFRGWIPRTLKVAPACAIMISSYEVGKKVFRGINERNYNGGEGDRQL